MHSEPDTDETPQARPRRARKRTAAEKVRAKGFPAAMRGYDREAVDAWREEIAELVTRLEEQEPADTAVRHAIDEVGRETSSILQRAHESASEIEARSRSQADARLAEADREAELTVREAEERADRLEEDTRSIWEQRLRLINEMRQLADEVLGVADDALERVDPPSGRRPEPGDEPEPDDQRDPEPDDQPEPAGVDLLDTVEDEPTLETENDTEDFDMASDETRVFRAPGDTEAFDPMASPPDDEKDTPPGADQPVDSVEGSQSPERL
ncbi:MAG: DivIVA domain-containing protein [Thermoleophilaceae bacterium]